MTGGAGAGLPCGRRPGINDAFFAQITDEEGEAMAFLLVKFPEHRMGLFIAAKPVATRADLMKVLAQIQL